jgi:4-amino-4-deoxy-L-arabinose transferase-like glycosyltransferase
MSTSRRLGSDEGGFAVVARHWQDGGDFLYGPQWVDRPPGLIGLFALADHLGPYGVRLMATLVAVGLVGALAWTAETVGGRLAARWAAWAGFAFASSVMLQAERLNGELAAALFVTVSIGAFLRAARLAVGRSRTWGWGALSGASAATAVLMKQNFVDAFVFAGVLATLALSTPRNRLLYRPSRVLLATAALVTGAAVPAAATVIWASGHGGVDALLYATVGFRADASAVMAQWSWHAPLHRLSTLAVLSCVSGLAILGGHLALSHRRRLLRLDPLPWAVAATASVELLGVLAGENFWSHYLIALIPTVALAAGLSVSSRASGARWTRRLLVLAAGVTALVSPVLAVNASQGTSQAYATGWWIAAAAEPADTIVVPFTHANVIHAAGLEPGYPYAWSLPLRTLDPQLTLLTSTLDGPDAPTWVVRWDDPHTWGLDPGNRVDAALRAHYRAVGYVCGHVVWLHDGVFRPLPPLPDASTCGLREQP